MYFRVFTRLAGSRRFGMGVGPIPISEVKAYCDLMGLEGEFERERLVRMLGVADGVYLEEAGKRTKQPKAQGRRPRRR